MSKKPKTIMPSPEEDQQIQANIDGDPDTFEWTEEDWKRARPARGRGKQKTPTKIRKTIRLSQEVIKYFQASGPGWQTRLDKFLREAIAEEGRRQEAEALREKLDEYFEAGEPHDLNELEALAEELRHCLPRKSA